MDMDTGANVSKAGLLWAAKVCEWRGDHAGAQRLASAALEGDEDFVDALMVRALSRRLLGAIDGPDGAIADYTRCIAIDAQCAYA